MAASSAPDARVDDADMPMERSQALAMLRLAEALLAGAGELAQAVGAACAGAELDRKQAALATVIGELHVEFLEPIYARYPDLRARRDWPAAAALPTRVATAQKPR